ncbi:fimbrillin family protein, partial [Parabacteroides sp. OttesenSCG-928-O15]|nr:fimbrillin family protein [Parabacteroides sp. OttesenSCG-928-O15]
MKTSKLLFVTFIALCLGGCATESDNDLLDTLSMKGKITAKILTNDVETKAGNGTVNWKVGEQVGLYVQSDGQMQGPLPLTIASVSGGSVVFAEPIPFLNGNRAHTFYAYYPYNAGDSSDPTRQNAPALSSTQIQIASSGQLYNHKDFVMAAPETIYPDEDLLLNFISLNSYFDFQVSSNVDGLEIKQILVEAPAGEKINFSGAEANITLPANHANFSKYTTLYGGSHITTLMIAGSLPVPNSTSVYASASVAFAPFNCSSRTLTVTVTTQDNQVFRFPINGSNYQYGRTYIIPLRIELDDPGVDPTPKDIRILSLDDTYHCYGFSTAGSLGNYDNTKVWNSFFGAMELRGRDMRRLLQQHFGKGKTVETGVISFETTDVHDKLNCLTDAYLDRFHIIFLNDRSRVNTQMAQKVMNWLARSNDRVLMLAYDWKDPTITPTQTQTKILGQTSTNYLMFRDKIIGVAPHWYNTTSGSNPSIGNWGPYRTGILVPFELNDRTSYFWKEGPFKTNLTKSSDLRYWIEDKAWGSAVVSDPNVIPLISYRDARNATNRNSIHKNGAGDGGMILGVDPVKRIVYVGDSEIFSAYNVPTYATDARLTEAYKDPNTINNYTKVIGNL